MKDSNANSVSERRALSVYCLASSLRAAVKQPQLINVQRYRDGLRGTGRHLEPMSPTCS